MREREIAWPEIFWIEVDDARASRRATQESEPAMLVRDAIGRALSTYFNRVDFSPVFMSSEHLDFGSIKGEWEYKQALSKLYERARGGFLTPSEIFAPWYSYGIARWMLEQGLERSPRIVEFGGGTGSNAVHLLDYLKSAAPEIYNRVQYVNVDVSRPLADLAQSTNARHEHRYRSVLSEDFSEKSNELTFVVALEFLDNLPHDKLRWYDDKPPEQARVSFLRQEAEEVFEPLTDEWIRAAAAVPRGGAEKKRRRWFFSSQEQHDAFVPTGALQWLARIKAMFPVHRLFIADFDALPPPTLVSRDHAANAPLVAAPDGRDRSSYLDALDGSADIFFPTDFHWLSLAYTHLAIGTAESDLPPPTVQKSSDFFRPFALPCRTISGYNPLLADFSNTSVFLRET